MMTKIFISKNRFLFSVVYILVFSILLTSCETVTTKTIRPDDISGPISKIENATHLVLKNAEYVSLSDKDVFYADKYKDLKKVIIVRNKQGYPERDTISNVTIHKFREKTYSISDVKEIYIEQREIDTKTSIVTTITVVLGAALLTLIVLFFVAINSARHSCPFTYSYDGTKYILDAEPLGGAICEGLERTDISKLELMKNIDGRFQFKVINSNDEQQRVDAMKFVSVKHSADENVTPDSQRKFYKYRNTVKPVSVINEEGTDITKFFVSKDDIRWQNDLPIDTTNKPFDLKEKLTLRFPRPVNAKSAMLIINGGASVFGSKMVPVFLGLKGNKVDDWYKSIYPGSEEQKKLFDVMHRDETFYMDIKVTEDGSLRNTGIMKSNGPMVDEDMLYPISLSNSNSDYVEIVLTPQRYFWKFDMINILYDYEEVNESDIEQLKYSYAKDNNGNNIVSKLNNADKDYYRMPNVGDFADLFINAPENYSEETNSIFVETTGWYDINLAKDKEPNDKIIDYIFSSKGGLLQYAMEIYFKNLKDITQAYNIKFGIR